MSKKDARETEKRETSGFVGIIEQFTEFIREKAEEDEDAKQFLPALEELSDHLKSAEKFQDEYPAIAGLLSNMCAAIEDHNHKLEMLKDVLVANGIGFEMSKDEMADQMLATMPKPDKDYMN